MNRVSTKMDSTEKGREGRNTVPLRETTPQPGVCNADRSASGCHFGILWLACWSQWAQPSVSPAGPYDSARSRSGLDDNPTHQCTCKSYGPATTKRHMKPIHVTPRSRWLWWPEGDCNAETHRTSPT